jgi:hypothetical protein
MSGVPFRKPRPGAAGKGRSEHDSSRTPKTRRHRRSVPVLERRRTTLPVTSRAGTPTARGLRQRSGKPSGEAHADSPGSAWTHVPPLCRTNCRRGPLPGRGAGEAEAAGRAFDPLMHDRRPGPASPPAVRRRRRVPVGGGSGRSRPWWRVVPGRPGMVAEVRPGTIWARRARPLIHGTRPGPDARGLGGQLRSWLRRPAMTMSSPSSSSAAPS